MPHSSPDIPYSFLALGDSYTIGEGLPLYESFPYHTLAYLRKSGESFHAPEIVAKTGWTTDELIAALDATTLLPSYDFVTLLIGVNNEYRGRKLTEYEVQLAGLIGRAILLAGNRPDHVFLLSIPDWSVSPFAASYLPDAAGRDKARIALEIDQFNTAAEKIAGKYAATFVNITAHTREATAAFAPDGLHPAGKEYAYWASLLAPEILQKLGRPSAGQ